MGNVAFDDCLLHQISRIGRFAFDTALTSKAPMSFYNLVCWHPCFSVETVDVLREKLQQQTFVRKQAHKRMRDCWPVFARIKLMC